DALGVRFDPSVRQGRTRLSSRRGGDYDLVCDGVGSLSDEVEKAARDVGDAIAVCIPGGERVSRDANRVVVREIEVVVQVDVYRIVHTRGDRIRDEDARPVAEVGLEEFVDVDPQVVHTACARDRADVVRAADEVVSARTGGRAWRHLLRVLEEAIGNPGCVGDVPICIGYRHVLGVGVPSGGGRCCKGG